MNTHLILKAVHAAGSQSGLAKAIQAPPALVWQWVHGRRPIAAKWCVPIETATGGQVTRHDLRPDIFGAGPGQEVAA